MNDKQDDEILQILRDTRALIRIGLGDRLEDLRHRVFGDDEQQMKAYRLFCEGKSYREIGEEVGTSHTTVGRWVEVWRKANLVHSTETRSAVTPELLGLD